MASAKDNIIQIDSDSEDDEQIRHAVALSLLDQDQIPVESSEYDNKRGPSTNPRHAQFGSMFLDRKAMEQERLQRLGKRSRESSDPAEAPQSKKASLYSSASPSDIKKQENATSSHSAAGSRTIPYLEGTVRRTWVQGYERRGDDIKIDEILQKDQLELAVISSFQWDEEWMISKINLAKTNIMLLAFAKDDAQKEIIQANAPPGIKFCFPPMYGLGAMHAKIQLLRFPGYLRLVIPTGNFVPHDWGETGNLENMVFLIDLPKLEAQARPQPTTFQKGLSCFLQAMGVSSRMIASISNYDFSKTEKLGFVYTVPGSHIGEFMNRIGFCGLGGSVAALGLASSEPIEVDVACASIGSLSPDLVVAIYKACQGNEAELPQVPGKSGNSKTAMDTARLQERFRIYFPTDRTVAQSKGGRQAGGTICIQAKAWTSSKFPTELMRDVVTTRDRLLIHSKVIFVRRLTHHDKGSVRQSPGWAYVGSANLSESAWDKATGKAKLNCRNWECGVVMPLPEEDRQPGASASISMFVGVVPVPMQIPGPRYGSYDRPWFFSGI